MVGSNAITVLVVLTPSPISGWAKVQRPDAKNLQFFPFLHARVLKLVILVVKFCKWGGKCVFRVIYYLPFDIFDKT